MYLNTKIEKIRRKFHEAVAFAPYRKGFSAYGNWLYANFEMWQRTSRISAKPLNIFLDVTNVCQLKCPLCPTGLGLTDKQKGKMDPALFRKLMDEIGDKLFFIDLYNWGEPLTNKDVLLECIRMTTERGVISTISTNLSLPMTDEYAEELVASGLAKMIVSLDGASAETYSVYRRGGDFNLAIENIQKLVAAKKKLGKKTPLIYWQFLVFRFNEHEMDQAREMAAEIGVDDILFEPPSIELDVYPIPEPLAQEMSNWYPSNPQFNLYFDPEHPDQPKGCITERKVIGNVKRCDWLYMASAIDWNGTVAPCCALYKEKDFIGDMGKQGEKSSYMEALNNEAYRNTRDRFAGRKSEIIPELPCEYCTAEPITCHARPFNKMIPFYLLVGTVSRIIEGIKRLAR